MKRIIVSVTNDLVTDQRVYKVCKTLEKLNFEILLIGRKLKNSPEIHRTYKTYRMRLLFNKGFMFYAEYNFRLFFKLFFTKKSVLLSNDLDTLLPNYLVSRIQRKKLVYDSHELFTEVPELISRPRVQKIWLTIEKWILPKLKHCYTVCDSIAEYYNNKYNQNFKVIRNLPEKSDPTKGNLPINTQNKKTIIYQGAVNIGRGIELMIQTMKFLNNHVLIVVGDGDILEDLKSLTKNEELEKKVLFLGRKTPDELKKITPKADLGVSLEEDLGLSYHYALPNKIFDYIHAGIPVLVSDLPEMKRIIKKYNVGEVILKRNPEDLAKQIETILKKGKALLEPNLKIAAKELVWDYERNPLEKIF